MMNRVPTRGLTPLLLGLATASCGPKGGDENSGTEMLDRLEFHHAEVARQAGAAPLVVRVLALNELGAPVPADDLSVQVNGETVSVPVSAYGLGELTLSDPGRYLIEAAGSAAVQVDVYERGWAGFPIGRSWPGRGSATHTDRVSDGFVIATATDLWWQPDVGAAERVLALPISGALEGVRVGQLDADGRQDVAAWTSNAIYFLRGVPSGGLAWAGGLKLSEGTLGGVALEDLDGDGVLDLGLGIAGVEEPRVELLIADGLFGYTLLHRISLLNPPATLAIGTNATTRLQRLVIAGDETWEVLREDEDGHYAVQATLPPFDLPADARFLDGGDFTGDRVDEAWLLAPHVEGQERVMHVIDLEATPVTYVTRSHVAAWATVQDAQGDGHDDLLTVDAERTLRVMVGADGVQEERNLGTLAAHGPAVLADVLGRSQHELFLAGAQRLYRYFGSTSESGNWRAAPDNVDNLLADLRQVYAIGDIDADPTTADWVGVQVRDDVVWAKAWSRAPGSPTVIEQARAQLAATETDFLDAARCGDDLWALTRAGLTRLDLSDELTASTTVPVIASRVACWDDGAGALRAGEIELFDRDGASLGTETAPGAQHLALAGSGAEPLIGTCDTAACQIAAWTGPWGTTFARTDSDGVTLDGAALGTAGALQLADVDGDGLHDLLTVEPSGALAVVRATPDGPGQPELFFLQRGLSGALTAVDADGDGTTDLLAVDSEQRLFLVLPPSE